MNNTCCVLNPAVTFQRYSCLKWAKLILINLTLNPLDGARFDFPGGAERTLNELITILRENLTH